MVTKKKAGADEAPATLDVSGQITVPLDGQDYLLRPSYEAILAIERELGPLFGLAHRATLGQLTAEEQAVCVAELMKAHGRADKEASADYRDPKPKRIGELIYEAGLPRICARLGVLLAGALNGGYDAAGEAKAAARP